MDLVNKTQATPTTKAESTSLTDELDVNTYKVEIVDNATEAVVRSFASYAKLKEALPLVVPVGNYKIVAKAVFCKMLRVLPILKEVLLSK